MNSGFYLLFYIVLGTTVLSPSKCFFILDCHNKCLKYVRNPILYWYMLTVIVNSTDKLESWWKLGDDQNYKFL